MPKYLVEMDTNPTYCDHCLFMGWNGNNAKCNITGDTVDGEPPYYYHSRPKDCPLEEVEWRKQYTIEALYKGGKEWQPIEGTYDAAEMAVGTCVMMKDARITRERVIETVVPPKDELSTVVWEG